MCGLAGTLIHDAQDKAALDRIRRVFTQNLLANEERGRDATGVAAISRHGGAHILKAPIPASRFIEQPEYLHFLENFITPDTTILLGHTRLPTKGEPENNDNNHPLATGDIVGIHNGTITNDDDIFLQLNRAQSRPVERIGSVDSESIFKLIDGIDSTGESGTYLQAIGQAAGRLIGSYATLFFNRRHPHLLFLLKYETPISVHYSPELKSLFFSSRYVFLRKAFGRSVITEALPNRTGYVFDSRRLPELQKTPLHMVRLPEMAKRPVPPPAVPNTTTSVEPSQ